MSSGSAEACETDRRGTVSGSMRLDEIKPRPHGDTRAVDRAHVESLAESIAVLGLLNPITVDLNGCLIAGAHRLAALAILSERGDWNDPVPVTVYPADVASDPKLALDLEVCENDKRRDYTPDEIRDLARRLKAAGYRADCGRPKRGEKAVIPALMVIVGKSRSQLSRVLAEQRRGTRRRSRTPEPLAAEVTEIPSNLNECGAAEEQDGEMSPPWLASVASRVAQIGEDVERVTILPLDEWSAIPAADVDALARNAERLADGLANLAAVARSALSLIGNGAESDGEEEVLEEEPATS